MGRRSGQSSAVFATRASQFWYASRLASSGASSLLAFSSKLLLDSGRHVLDLTHAVRERALGGKSAAVVLYASWFQRLLVGKEKAEKRTFARTKCNVVEQHIFSSKDRELASDVDGTRRGYGELEFIW